MPNTLRIKLGDDTFDLEGDFEVGDAAPLLNEFIRGRGADPTQDAVDKLTAEVRDANDAEAAAVAANTPT